MAFRRDADDQTLTCIFNLSTDDFTLSLDTDTSLSGPHHASLGGDTLTLPGNGFAYLAHSGKLNLKL